uniref:Amidophosphoribosyltransferase n=1 Tax=Thermocrispum agreste TaxID=37925 RepID=A0A2W4JQX0_9PSEU|nr:MAG: amidophosphoribosyltransferase [Thermocrispum agreste]
MRLLDLIFPVRCAACGAVGSACCDRCLSEFTGPLPVPRPLPCGVPAFTMAGYRGPARQLVLAYKERGRRDLARVLGRVLADGVLGLRTGSFQGDGEVRAGTSQRDRAAVGIQVDSGRNSGTGCRPSGRARDGPGAADRGSPDSRPRTEPAEDAVVLVPVPSTKAAARMRGGQHVLRLAEACAAELASAGVPTAVAPALRLTSGVRDAVGLDAVARAANLAGRMRVVRDGCPAAGTEVVVLDDVLTTGATAAEAVRVLDKAKVVVAAVLTLTSPQAFRWVQ